VGVLTELNEREELVQHRQVSNILVTSISQKIPMLREIRNAAHKMGRSFKIFGGDSNREALGRFFVDEFWHMPLISQISASAIIEYCQNKQINALIPTRDGELLFFAENKGDLEKAGIHVMISPRDSIRTCLDKVIFSEVLQELGYPVIPTYIRHGDLKSDCLAVKERFGAGSKSIGLCLTSEAAQYHAKLLKEPIFQPFINGREYSVDVYVDKLGKIKGAVARERVVVVNGESQVTTTVLLPALEDMCGKVAQKLKFYGHIIFQVIIDNDGSFHIIECNPRFGGASSLSIAAGLDSFYWFLLECGEENLSSYPFIRSAEELTQVRYPDDMIIRCSNLPPNILDMLHMGKIRTDIV